jgi:hypothetical protein
MTQPQSDPATDVGAALARLAEQAVAFQRQIEHLERSTENRAAALEQHVEARVAGLDELTSSRFVTYRTLIDSQAEKVALALDATERANVVLGTTTEKAITKAEIANDKRFDAVNEFRSQLADQARTFMPRTEAVQLADAATARIREIGDRLPALVTRTEVTALFDRHSEQIRDMADRMNRSEGRGQGAKDNSGKLYLALGLAVAVISVVVAVANILSRNGAG